MDIEERAEKWAKTGLDELGFHSEGPYSIQEMKEACIQAYLAGSAQTQKDYIEHFMGKGDKEWS